MKSEKINNNIMNLKNNEMFEKCLQNTQKQKEYNVFVDLQMIFSEYSQVVFKSYGDIFYYSELEQVAAKLMNNDFSKLPEVIKFDKEGVIWVHPDIAESYLKILSEGGGWKSKTIKITTMVEKTNDIVEIS